MASKRLFTILAVLSLIGAAISAWLTKLFYDIRVGAAGFQSACNFGENMNCDAVAASPYAEFLAGVPLSSVSAGWFLATFVVALFGRNLYWRREVARVLFLMTGVSVLASLFYFVVMAFTLKTFCLFCLIIEAIAVASFVIVLRMKPEGFKEHQADRAKWKTLLGSAGAALLVSVLFLMAFKKPGMSNEAEEQAVQRVMSESPLPVGESIPSMSLGPKDAPVVITEFIDFQCPACRAGAQVLTGLQNRYPEKVRVIVRNFPLDPSCNPAMKHSGHPAACEAARATICASQQGKLKEAYRTIFENQPELDAGVPTRLVSELPGIDASSLQACMGSEETRQVVARDLREGEQLHIRGTPSFFVNGRRVPGILPLTAWDEIVQRLLEQN